MILRSLLIHQVCCCVHPYKVPSRNITNNITELNMASSQMHTKCIYYTCQICHISFYMDTVEINTTHRVSMMTFIAASVSNNISDRSEITGFATELNRTNQDNHLQHSAMFMHISCNFSNGIQRFAGTTFRSRWTRCASTEQLHFLISNPPFDISAEIHKVISTNQC